MGIRTSSGGGENTLGLSAGLHQATYDRNRAADTWLFVAAGIVEIAMLVAVLVI